MPAATHRAPEPLPSSSQVLPSFDLCRSFRPGTVQGKKVTFSQACPPDTQSFCKTEVRHCLLAKQVGATKDSPLMCSPIMAVTHLEPNSYFKKILKSSFHLSHLQEITRHGSGPCCSQWPSCCHCVVIWEVTLFHSATTGCEVRANTSLGKALAFLRLCHSENLVGDRSFTPDSHKIIPTKIPNIMSGSPYFSVSHCLWH